MNTAPMSTGIDTLLVGAREHSALDAVDYFTLDDLISLSGCNDEVARALVLCLLLAREEGSLCVRLDQTALERLLSRVVSLELASEWALKLRTQTKPGAFSELISADGTRPLVLTETGRVFRLYFQRLWKHERILASRLQTRLKIPSGDFASLEQMNAVLDEILIENPCKLPNGLVAPLNSDQARALGLALLNSFTVISGGPGTGKTFLIFSLLRSVLRLGVSPERIRLAAPTGRAAQRLKDQIAEGLNSLGADASQLDRELEQIPAETLHRTLGYMPSSGDFRYHEFSPLAADVVVVDEVSMVDAVMMSQLLSAVPIGAKLILLGDKDQLPSVDAGAVLAHLVSAPDPQGYSKDTQSALRTLFPKSNLEGDSISAPASDCIAILKQNYRSKSQIQEVALAVNSQSASVLEVITELALEIDPSQPPHLNAYHWLEPGAEGCFFIDTEKQGAPTARSVLQAWARATYFRTEADIPSYLHCATRWPNADSDERTVLLQTLFDKLSEARILTVTRRGARGCEALNSYLAAFLRQPFGAAFGRGIFPGTPVMLTGNSPDRELYNGDVGVLLEDETGAHLAAFSRPQGPVLIGRETLPAFEPAFATTVHKSQGSEYREVLVFLPDDAAHALLTKELLYTAITRAKERCVIFGSRAALRRAVETAVVRESGLNLWTGGTA